MAGTSNNLFLITSLFSVVDHWDLLDLSQKRICIPQLEIGVCSKGGHGGCQFEHEFTHVEVEGAIQKCWGFEATFLVHTELRKLFLPIFFCFYIS